MIRLDHVDKDYRIDGNFVFPALKDICFTIKNGEYVAIIGPSGSGKSTLMHIVGLLDKPSRGKVFIEDKDISTINDNDLSSLRSRFVGFVFQQFNLIPKLSILENIMLPTIYARTPLPFNPRRKAMDLLTRFGIADKQSSYPNKLSGGQQQRVAIARALMMEPKLILADEPTGNLDTKSGTDILNLIEDLHRKDGITVLMVTHDMSIAKRTKRTIKIVDGSIV